MSISHMQSSYKAVSNWLFFVAAMVLAMAVIGAITRLTESGLSMVEWRPLIGTLPPMTDAEWQRVFDLTCSGWPLTFVATPQPTAHFVKNATVGAPRLF